uniref:Cystatin domain-containing protein n=1 Tax=Oryzias sinensis TaxID=183150 RepID=A0A8C7ZZA6_9TELE
FLPPAKMPLIVNTDLCLQQARNQTSPQKVLVSSANVSTAARFAIGEFNKANTEDYHDDEVCPPQIVAGINYILDAQLGRTVCKRKDTVDCQLCALRTDPKECQCHFIVTNIPWEKNAHVLTENKCQKIKC